MAQGLVLFVMFLYLLTGFDFIRQGQIGLGITFIFYAGANLGLYLTARGF